MSQKSKNPYPKRGRDREKQRDKTISRENVHKRITGRREKTERKKEATVRHVSQQSEAWRGGQEAF